MEFLPLVGIVLLFWLFIIRPQSRRQKELRTMQSSLSVGDEVVLTSGIFGTVQRIDDDRLGIEIATGVVVEIARGAIGSKVERHPDVEDVDDAPDAEGVDQQEDSAADAEHENGKPGDRPEGN